jgi:hypothetical protein
MSFLKESNFVDNSTPIKNSFWFTFDSDTYIIYSLLLPELSFKLHEMCRKNWRVWLKVCEIGKNTHNLQKQAEFTRGICVKGYCSFKKKKIAAPIQNAEAIKHPRRLALEYKIIKV